MPSHMMTKAAKLNALRQRRSTLDVSTRSRPAELMIVAVKPLAERRPAFHASGGAPGSAPEPTGALALELVHTVGALAPVIGVAPAICASIHVCWVDPSATHISAEAYAATVIAGAEGYLCEHYISTPDVFSPEPFAALPNVCFWASGAALLVLPALTNTELPVATLGMGVMLALLGVGSLVLHNTASRERTWQRAMGMHMVLAVAGCALTLALASLASTIRGPAVFPGDPLATWSQVLAMLVALLLIVCYEGLPVALDILCIFLPRIYVFFYVFFYVFRCTHICVLRCLGR